MSSTHFQSQLDYAFIDFGAIQSYCLLSSVIEMMAEASGLTV